MYDYYTGVWTKIAPMKNPRCTHALFLYKGYIYVLGGFSGKKERTKDVNFKNHIFKFKD